MSATSSEVASPSGVDPLYQLIQAAGLEPLLLHIRLTTEPSATGPDTPTISAASGRTGK